MDSLPEQPQSPEIPHGIRKILPAGKNYWPAFNTKYSKWLFFHIRPRWTRLLSEVAGNAVLTRNFIKKTTLNYFQPKLLLLFCSNLIFKHKCQFNFQQTTLWTVYTIWMLTNCGFQHNTQFLFWANFVFNIQGFLQSCPTQILSCPDTTVFSSEQKGVLFQQNTIFMPTKTQFSDCQRRIQS